MTGFNRGQYASTPLQKSGLAGDFCARFADELQGNLPDLIPELSGMIDMDGTSAGLMLNLQSPHITDNIYLEVFVLEEHRRIEMNFTGFRRSFLVIEEAIDFINRVLTDRIVLVIRYENRRLDDESIEDIEDALDILNETSHAPAGCLAYIVPRKLVRVWIKSWNAKHNQNAHNY